MQYRIVRNNKCSIGYRYYIQKKYFGLFWFNTCAQAYNEYDLDQTKEQLSKIIADNRRYILRKLTKNNEVVL